MIKFIHCRSIRHPTQWLQRWEIQADGYNVGFIHAFPTNEYRMHIGCYSSKPTGVYQTLDFEKAAKDACSTLRIPYTNHEVIDD